MMTQMSTVKQEHMLLLTGKLSSNCRLEWGPVSMPPGRAFLITGTNNRLFTNGFIRIVKCNHSCKGLLMS